jgi:hypothetical protein
MLAFSHAEQALFEERRELALAQHQRGRVGAEGRDDVGTVRAGKAVVQGQVGRFGDDSRGSIGHVIVVAGKPLL